MNLYEGKWAEAFYGAFGVDLNPDNRDRAFVTWVNMTRSIQMMPYLVLVGGIPVKGLLDILYRLPADSSNLWLSLIVVSLFAFKAAWVRPGSDNVSQASVKSSGE